MAKVELSLELSKADQVRAVTGPRLDATSAYLSTIALELGVGEWELRLKLDRRPSSDEAMAEIVVVRNRRIASILLSEDFYGEPADRQRHYLAHELIHLLTNDVRARIHDDALDEVMGKPAAALWRSAARDAEEALVDRLAELFAPHLPLPELDAGAVEGPISAPNGITAGGSS